MLRVLPGEIFKIPVLATTQNKKRLGEFCPELSLDKDHKTLIQDDKTLFSMLYGRLFFLGLSRLMLRNFALPDSNSTNCPSTPNVRVAMATLPAPLECVIVGIESHICVTQTALDLLRAGHKVYVLADGVSSCNKEEIPIALARLRAEGAIVTTSESWIYECVGDAGLQEFKQVIGLIKESHDSTKEALHALCKI